MGRTRAPTARPSVARKTTPTQTDDNKRQRFSAHPVLFLVGVVVVLYFVYQHIEKLRELGAVQAQIAEMQQNITLGQQSTLDLQAKLSYASSDEYVVQVARGELGYIQDGDEVYVLLDAPSADVEILPTASPTELEEDSFRPLDWSWWQSLFQWDGQAE